MSEIDLKTAKGESTLDEIFKHMRLIQVKTSKTVELNLFSDGAGTIFHNEVERRFGTLPIALHKLQKLYELGYMP